MELDAHLTFFGSVSPCGIIFVLQQHQDVTCRQHPRAPRCFHWAVRWEVTRSTPVLFCQFTWARHSKKLFIQRKNVLWIWPHVVVKDNMAPGQERFSLLSLLNPQGDNYTLLLQEAFPLLKCLHFPSWTVVGKRSGMGRMGKSLEHVAHDVRPIKCCQPRVWGDLCTPKFTACVLKHGVRA